MRTACVGAVLAAVVVAVTALHGCRGAQENPAATDETASQVAHKGGGDVQLCEHRVPAALCTQCTPDLVEVFKLHGDWCQQHGVPESQCLRCNPDLDFSAAAAAPKDWCKEHLVPESKCTKCNPNLIAALVEAGSYCRVHGFAADVCPFCHPDLVRAAGQVPPAQAQLTTKVRLASTDTAADAGIETRKIERRRFAPALEVVGRLAFDQNELAQLSSPTDALVVEVNADIGDEVAANQPLLVLASAEVGEGQAQLSSARAQVAAAQANVERESGLARKGISSRRSVEEAQAQLARARAEYEQARSRLGAAAAPDSGGGGGRYVLASPLGGTVVLRDVMAGRSVGAGQVLMQVADLSVLWALLEVPEADAGSVRVGQLVELFLEGGGEETLQATITRVGSSVDATTRTVPARVELANPQGRLKAGTFVRAKIQVAAEHDALLVPRDAVQKAEGRLLVFVRKAADLFQPVTVQLGSADGDDVEVTSGLAAGEEVVTSGAFWLKTEILKDSIGAGCCEESE